MHPHDRLRVFEKLGKFTKPTIRFKVDHETLYVLAIVVVVLAVSTMLFFALTSHG